MAAQARARMADQPGAKQAADDVLELLATVFRDQHTGEAANGTKISQPKAIKSTAESVNVAHAALLDATYLDMGGRYIARQLQGVVFKDDSEDARLCRCVRARAGAPLGPVERVSYRGASRAFTQWIKGLGVKLTRRIATKALFGPKAMFAPIRHHSPACAWHLRQMICSY
ncbi:MAG: hypothetical protein JKX69_03515 [Rhodobacteraceae bacterium]|nr:hypothetical protein [Paracoccaceae bacterium]